jgi:hypothetical protein
MREAFAVEPRRVHAGQHEADRIGWVADWHIHDARGLTGRRERAPKGILAPVAARGGMPNLSALRGRVAEVVHGVLAGIVAGDHRRPGRGAIGVGPRIERTGGAFADQPLEGGKPASLHERMKEIEGGAVDSDDDRTRFQHYRSLPSTNGTSKTFSCMIGPWPK